MLMSAPYIGMKRATAIPTIHLKRLDIDLSMSAFVARCA